VKQTGLQRSQGVTWGASRRGQGAAGQAPKVVYKKKEIGLVAVSKEHPAADGAGPGSAQQLPQI